MAGERSLPVAVDDCKHEEPQTDEDGTPSMSPALVIVKQLDWWGNISLGDQHDVRDTEGYWCEAEVLKIDAENRRVFVTFIYWDNVWDAWISEHEGRIAPLHTHTYTENSALKVGQRIETLDKAHVWLQAYVIDISEERDQVKIHYKGWHIKFDEWIDRKAPRFRPYGRNKPIVVRRRREQKLWRVPGQAAKAQGGEIRASIKSDKSANSGNDSGGNNHQSDPASFHKQNTTLSGSAKEDAEHKRQISEISDRYNQYIEALRTQSPPLKVVSVPGDGNCLFRSVAHQVYGDYELHNLVRQCCMDYMEADSGFYSQFVEGGMEAFPFYLRAKRLNACWGDDPEIQSICELYNRPAEIWAYDTQRGARKLRTFHEATGRLSTQLPLRLSYYGGGHYDSIIDAKHSDQLLQTVPGEAETLALTRVTERVALASSSFPLMEATRLSDYQATEQAAVDLAVEMSCNDNERFDWQEDLETCLSMSLEDSYSGSARDSAAITANRSRQSNPENGNALASANQPAYSDSSMSSSTSVANTAGQREGSEANQSASLIAIQGDILRTVAAESERDYLERAMLSSLTDDSLAVEQQLLDQARLESIADAEAAEALQFSSWGKITDPSEYSTEASIGMNSSAALDMRDASEYSRRDSDIDLILKLSELSEDEALQMALRESTAAAATRPQILRFVQSTSSSSSSSSSSAYNAPTDQLSTGRGQYEGDNDALGTALRMYVQSTTGSTNSNTNRNVNVNNQRRNDAEEDEEDELQRAIAESLR